MLRFRCLIFSLLATLTAFSQKGDTLRKYLDQGYSLSKRGRAVYPALAIRKDDHWMLIATYPDTSLLLVAWFKDKNLTIKDGPYSFYYGNGKQYVQGYFVNNLPMGGWQYWYANGVLKDSGVMQNGQMVQTWKSWHENGSLMAIGNYKFDSSIVVLPPAADGAAREPRAGELHAGGDLGDVREVRHRLRRRLLTDEPDAELPLLVVSPASDGVVAEQRARFACAR